MPFDQTESRSLKLRQKLDHPVVDGDGHTQEYHPILLDYLKESGGAGLVDRYKQVRFGGESWQKQSREERFDKQTRRPPFWTMPAKNTLDLATAMLPNLFRARLDDLGIDFAVVYSSQFFFATCRDDELRQAGCRAINKMNRDLFAEYSDRMTPAAVIPTWTPEEAIDEMEYSIHTLGLKAIQLTDLNYRPIPIIEREAPQLSPYVSWIDPLVLDSVHDYDPMWAKCVELKVAPTCHVGGQGWGARRSISNYVYNHIGAFAAANDASCKALFLGGVTRRFPELRFGFLEGGTAWAVMLYNDLFEHWEKRNVAALHDNLDPARIDRGLLRELVQEYGGDAYAPYLDNFKDHDERMMGARPGFNVEDYDCMNDWAACGIEKEEDIYDLFVPKFFFGCEADDRTLSTAFDARMNHEGARLNAMFSSDVSHWDVPDMTETLVQAHGLVDKGLIDDDDFRDFTFTNIVRLHGEVNPDFFKGTTVESAAAKVLA
ncbi:MAG: amidohydrolase [Alphaproteobacteria bacterium]|nr:amidohydrolase [Alphaproteobacteria bacterium]